MSAATTPDRLCALPGYSTSTVRAAGGLSGERRRRRCRRSSRRRTGRGRARRRRPASMPGAGLRQSQGPRRLATSASGWCRHSREASQLHALGREQLEHALVDRRAAARASRCPWRPPAGWTRRRARSPRSASRLAASAAPGSRRTSSVRSGDSMSPDAGSGAPALSVPSRSRNAAAPVPRRSAAVSGSNAYSPRSGVPRQRPFTTTSAPRATPSAPA